MHNNQFKNQITKITKKANNRTQVQKKTTNAMHIVVFPYRIPESNW